jgi:hypothetical protein
VVSDTVYIGICDECRTAKQFLSEEARNAWEQSHPHEEEDE